MNDTRSLPPPRREGAMSLEAALDQRRTCRDLSHEPLDDRQTGQLLWAAQGVNAHGRRTAPSAGGLYPLEVYSVEPDGCAHYDPGRHLLRKLSERDLRSELADAALAQDFIAHAPLTLVLCADFARIARRYGTGRGPRYVHIEIGHAAQNVLLQAAALGLGAVPVGAFDDQAVQRLLELPPDHEPLYLLPIGRPLRG